MMFARVGFFALFYHKNERFNISEVLEAFFLGMRFEDAANTEGNPVEAYFLRYWHIIREPYMLSWVDFFGIEGIGSATRAGVALAGMLGISTQIGFVETSWSQPILDNGLLIGKFQT